VRAAVLAVVVIITLTAATAVAQESARPWIGISIEPGARGVRVKQTVENTPAARAGIEAGDEVVAIDGTPVADPTALIAKIGERGVGQTVTLTLYRDGKQRAVKLALENRPDEMALLRERLVGKPAPRFALAAAQGPYPAKLDALAGQVVVVEFWATWCAPCNTTLPVLSAWQEKYGARGLRVVGLSTEPLDVISRHLAKKGAKLSYTVASDDGAAIYDAYHVPSVPTLVVIDRRGKVRHVEVGAGSKLDGVEQVFRAALAEK
jgi:peroxiredoxin